MRIQKAIAQSGVASRREAETLVLEGRVKVNHRVVLRPGTDVNPAEDLITIDDKPIPKAQAHVYYAFHKPKGTVCTRNDPEERPTIYERLSQIPYRIESMGRLDINTSGLLLLTNDGQLAQKLLKPASDVPKRYKVKVWKEPSERQLNRIRHGIPLDDGRTKPAKIRIIESTDSNNTWLEITVTEGRNRLIRRIFESIGHPVSKLQRLSFATIGLGQLEVGQWRPLSGDEIQRLKEIADGVEPNKAGQKTRYKKGFARPKPKPNKPLSRKKKQKKGSRS
ncbi:MAG: pseudouridine synthase [Myxococcota bacterium]|nr:pseudouridine synthase [Myxococcota bacterium]